MSRFLTEGFELRKASSNPLDPSKFMFLVIKCPNCEKLIRFSMLGTFGLGWSMRTFYCKACQQTHSITMFFEARKQVATEHVDWIDLTQSLWRSSGARFVRKAYTFSHLGIKVDNPAKMLGYPSEKIARWLKKYVTIFMQHLSSTISEPDLHEIEKQSIELILAKLQYILNILNYHIKEI
jgi:hypothetical protein